MATNRLQALMELEDQRNQNQYTQSMFGNPTLNMLANVINQTSNPNTEIGSALTRLTQTYNQQNQQRGRQLFFDNLQRISMSNSNPDEKINAIIGLTAQHGTDYGLDLENTVINPYMEMMKLNRRTPYQPVVTGFDQGGRPIITGHLPPNAKYVPDKSPVKVMSAQDALKAGQVDPNTKILSSSNIGITVPENLPPLPRESSDREKSQWLAQFDPATASVIQGLADYTLDPAKVSSFRGGERRILAGLAKRFDPNFDMKKYPQRQDFMKSMARTNTGSMGFAKVSLNTLFGHLELLEQMSQGLKNGSLTPVNAIITTAQQLTGNPNIVSFLEAKSVVDSELERALTGVGVTQEGLRARERIFNEKASPEQMIGAINTMKHIVAARLKALEGQYKSIMGKQPPKGTFVDPEHEAYIRQYMSHSSGSGKSSTIYANNPSTGERIVSMDGGKTWNRVL